MLVAFGQLKPFVIGVHVVADTRDPNTFYAVWLEYLSGLLDGTGTNTLQLAKSTDGGQSWSSPVTVSRFLPLPRLFPRQAFRLLGQLGFAQRLDSSNKTVLRGGFGIFHPTGAAQGAS